MSERIQQLAEQAGSTHKQNLGVYQFYTDELEKFAELIVKECCELTLDYKGDDYYSGWLDYRDEIKRHFGVDFNDACKPKQGEPVAFINVEKRSLEWVKPISWHTPTTVNLPNIPLYTTPPQRTEQEPVCDKDPQGCWNVRCQLGKKCKNTPPQRTWVGLTDEEIQSCWDGDLSPYQMQCIREIEAKLKEKNT
jgi:hypothetical protein